MKEIGEVNLHQSTEHIIKKSLAITGAIIILSSLLGITVLTTLFVNAISNLNNAMAILLTGGGITLLLGIIFYGAGFFLTVKHNIAHALKLTAIALIITIILNFILGWINTSYLGNTIALGLLFTYIAIFLGIFLVMEKIK